MHVGKSRKIEEKNLEFVEANKKRADCDTKLKKM